MLVNIALFILGLAIGLLACSVYTRWQDKQFMDLMASNQDFLKKYAQLTEQQYDNLDRYVSDQMTLLNETVYQLLGISQQMSKENADNGKKMLELFRQDHNNKGQLITNLTDFVKEHEKINDGRWSLITDYITNDGPERAEENYLVNGPCDKCTSIPHRR